MATRDIRTMLLGRRRFLGLTGGVAAAGVVAAACGDSGGTYIKPASAASASAAQGAAATPTPAGPSVSNAKQASAASFATPPPFKPHVDGQVVEFKLTSFDGPDQTIKIAEGKAYESMNFDGQVPAPTLRVTEGDTVRFTLQNNGKMAHSIDFHAAQTAWSKNYQPVAPGASLTFDWTAKYPGVFMYHCGVPPVIMHIADGMYGAVIVDPKEGRAPATEFILVQSEFYGSGHDVQAMLNRPPDFVVFNGEAFRYKAAPLQAKVGKLVRFFVVNAGPSSISAFHVIGELFDRVELDGNPKNAMGMRQTVEVLPGAGILVELTIEEAGKYPFVTHKFNDAEKGAVGVLEVT